MTSKPVYTSTAEGFRDAKEIAGLRPMAAPKPRAPRKQAEKRIVTNGIVCFCGERFAESQALEFMLHLRAEVGDDLAVLERRRERDRRYTYTSEYREKRRLLEKTSEYREKRRQRRNSPEWRERRSTPEHRASERERAREYRERNRERINMAKREHRARNPPTPEQAERKRQRDRARARERRARKKAEREAADVG